MGPPKFEVRRLSAIERHILAPLRASAWRGALTEAQFVHRNEILYGGDFAKDRIRTFGLFIDAHDRGPVATCDFVTADCFTKEQGIQRVDILASAITLPEFSKQGWMSRLLEHAFATLPSTSLLYSEVGPKFYHRFGFAEDTWAECKEPVTSSGGEPSTLQLATAEGFAKGILHTRMEKVAAGKADVAFVPDAGWIRWVEQKYGFLQQCASENTGKAPSPNGPSLVQYGVVVSNGAETPVALFEDALERVLDVVWADVDYIQNWKPVAMEVARQRGLDCVRYWDRNPTGEAVWPMFHPGPADSPPAVRGLRLELSLGDWW